MSDKTTPPAADAREANRLIRDAALEEAARMVEGPPAGAVRYEHKFKLWGFTPRSFQEDLARAVRALMSQPPAVDAREAEVQRLREALENVRKVLDDGGMWSLAEGDEGNSVTEAMDLIRAALSSSPKDRGGEK